MPSSPSPSGEAPLVCPRCAKSFPLSERFCGDCGMPLVYAGRTGEEPITEAHERARKIKPQYTRGEAVKVTFARNQAMAEMIQGMLLEEGIPSFLKRTRGFDAPEFLAGGPRDVFVPGEALPAAREVLAAAGEGAAADAGLEQGEPGGPELPGIGRGGGGPGAPSPVRLFGWILVCVAIAALIVWLLYLAST